MTDNAKPAFVGTSEAPCSARHTIEQNPHAMGPTWRINRPNRWGDRQETFAYAWKQVDAQMIADALNTGKQKPGKEVANG